MPGTVRQPSHESTVSNLIARVEVLERRLSANGAAGVASPDYVMVAKGTGGSLTHAASGATIYTWAFVLPFDAYVLVEGDGTLFNSIGTTWSGSIELFFDLSTNDGYGAAPWHVTGSTIGDEYPVACMCYGQLAAGAHTLILKGSTNGSSGETGIPGFDAHLVAYQVNTPFDFVTDLIGS